jgi:hypothetical protein
MFRIVIYVQHVTLYAELFDSGTAREIYEALPLEAVPEEWGDEFFFEIPVRKALDQTATSEVKTGDIGYWPPGNALAIFFGPTPISRGSDPVPASDVNLVGKIIGDPTQLREAKGAQRIRVEQDNG